MFPTHTSRGRERAADYRPSPAVVTSTSSNATIESPRRQYQTSRYHTYGQDEPFSHQYDADNYGGK